MKVETNFESFLKTDMESSMKLTAFDDALDSRKSYSRRLSGTTGDIIYMSKDLFFAYYLLPDAGSEDILSARVIRAIAKFEKRLRTLPEWNQLCGRAPPEFRGLCEPGISFANYMLPEVRHRNDGVAPEAFELNGNGYDMTTQHKAYSLVRLHGLTQLLLPSDYKVGNPLKQMRSAFRFKVFLLQD
jgi:hypothetical protein